MKAGGFTVIPAIDIRGGRSVRLWQGDYGKETVYFEHPEEVALLWERSGATLIHVVDLDGAATGSRVNRAAVERIVSSVSVPVELGGGIRDRQAMEDYLALGVRRLVLGTAACREPRKLGELLEGFPGEVFVGLDAREGYVAVEGWKETLSLTASRMARWASEAGVAGIIYTDISRDGTLVGPNFPAIERFLEETDLPVVASGGVSSLEDIAALAAMAPRGLIGAIVGRALYTGQVRLEEALRFNAP